MPPNSASSLRNAEQQRRRLATLLTIGNLVLRALLAVMVAYVLKSSRETHEEQSKAAAERLVAIASASLEAELGMIDTALRISATDLQRARFLAKVPDAEIDETLASTHRELGGVEGFRLADEHGLVRWGNLVDSSDPPDVAHRDFFQQAKEPSSGKAVISGPVVSRISGNWVLIVARPLTWKGQFKGVLYASINVEHFKHIFKRYDLAQHDAIALRSSDLKLIAWLSPGSTATAAVGTQGVTQELHDAIGKNPSAGSFFATSQVDARNRTVAYHQVDGWPLLTIAGFDNEQFFDQWRGEMRTLSILALLVWVLSCAATFAVFKFGKREMRAITALESSSRRTQTLFRVAGDGIHIVDGAGTLLELSDSFAEMHGTTREQLQGRHISSWDVNQDEARINAWLARIRDGDRQRVEVQHRRSDGGIIDVDLHWRAVEIDGLLLIFGSARDITERKRLLKDVEEAAAQLRNLYDHAPCGYFSLDGEGRFVHANSAASEWMGADFATTGNRFSDVLDPVGREVFKNHFVALAAEQHGPEIEVWFYPRGGKRRYVRINSTAIRDADGTFRMSRTVAVDITAQHEAQQQVQALLRDQSAMLNSDIVGMAKLRGGKIIWKNAVFERMLGYRDGELYGVDIETLCVDEDDRRLIATERTLLVSGSFNFRENVRFARKDGEAIWVDLNGVQLSADESFWMAVDISEAKRAHDQISHVAFHDALTQLPNRLLLIDRMRQSLAAAERFKYQVAVCFIDLDGFKAVNDVHGHDAGDKLLIEIAARIVRCIRATDSAARLGGDEFVVLLAPVAQDEWRAILERLMQAVEAPMTLRVGLKVAVGLSIGVALANGRTQAEALVTEADEAMLLAKRAGKRRIHLASPGS